MTQKEQDLLIVPIKAHEDGRLENRGEVDGPEYNGNKQYGAN